MDRQKALMDRMKATVMKQQENEGKEDEIRANAQREEAQGFFWIDFVRR